MIRGEFIRCALKQKIKELKISKVAKYSRFWIILKAKNKIKKSQRLNSKEEKVRKKIRNYIFN